MKYDIHTKQSFNDTGTLGVLLFLGAPILAALGYLWLISELHSFRPSLVGPAMIFIAAGMGSLGGTVCMLIGRETFATAYPKKEA